MNKEIEIIKQLALSIAEKIYNKKYGYNINTNINKFFQDRYLKFPKRIYDIQRDKYGNSYCFGFVSYIINKIQYYNIEPTILIIKTLASKLYAQLPDNIKNKIIVSYGRNAPYESFVNTFILCTVIRNYLNKKQINNAVERRKYATLAYNAVGMHGMNTAKLNFRNRGSLESNRPAGAGVNNYRLRENRITRILRRIGWNNTNETRKRVHNLLEKGYFNNNENTGGVYESKDDS